MHSAKTGESRRGETARQPTARPTNESSVEAPSPHSAGSILPNPEVVARPTRRRFTAADKLRILKLADACTAVGSLGALLRAEGLYASNLRTWRRQRMEGTLSALTPQKRGRKVVAPQPLRAENERLRQENARLSTRLKQAELIIEVQKKVSQILGLPLETPAESGHS
jgi:transposase